MRITYLPHDLKVNGIFEVFFFPYSVKFEILTSFEERRIMPSLMVRFHKAETFYRFYNARAKKVASYSDVVLTGTAKLLWIKFRDLLRRGEKNGMRYTKIVLSLFL